MLPYKYMDPQIESLLQSNRKAIYLFHLAAMVGSIITSIIGIISIATSEMHISPAFTINLLHAVFFLSVGITLFTQIKKSPFTSRSLWFFLSLIFSCITFFISCFMILQLLLPNNGTPNQIISPDTSITLFLISTALLFFQFPRIKYFTRIGQTLTLIASLSTMFTVLGYVYQLFSLHQIIPFTPMLLSTAIMCTIICISLVAATADHGFIKILTQNSASSKLALRLIIITLTLPAIIGYCLLWGQKLHIFSMQTGIPLFVITTIILFSIIIWINTRKLQKIELENLLIKNALENENIKLKIDTEKLANKALELEERKEQAYDYLTKANLFNPPKSGSASLD